MIKLETDRLIIRDYTSDDEELYYRLKSDDKAMYYLQDIKLYSPQAARQDFENMLRDMDSQNRQLYFLHFELKSTHQQIGSVGYTVTNNTPVGRLVHAGYFTYPEFWGNGYVAEAFIKVMEYAFAKNGVYRITTGCLTENRGSERVMQKCGLVKEAEHVDWEWHDGKMKTRVEYRILRGEWESTWGTILR